DLDVRLVRSFYPYIPSRALQLEHTSGRELDCFGQQQATQPQSEKHRVPQHSLLRASTIVTSSANPPAPDHARNASTTTWMICARSSELISRIIAASRSSPNSSSFAADGASTTPSL